MVSIGILRQLLTPVWSIYFISNTVRKSKKATATPYVRLSWNELSSSVPSASGLCNNKHFMKSSEMVRITQIALLSLLYL